MKLVEYLKNKVTMNLFYKIYKPLYDAMPQTGTLQYLVLSALSTMSLFLNCFMYQNKKYSQTHTGVEAKKLY